MVTVVMLAALAVWAAWTLQLSQQNRSLSYQLEAERQRNFSEMIGHVEAMRGVMGKSLAAGSTRQNAHYMGEVYRRASLATSNYMALPLPADLGSSTGKFLNQVGDFSYSIARSEAAGRAMDAQQREELTRLYTTASNLTQALQHTGRASLDDGFRWAAPNKGLSDLFASWRQRLAGGGKNTQDQSPKSLIPAGLQKIGPQMDQVPVLVYDGPFSDHLEKRAPALGGPTITADEAQRRALTFVPQPEGVTVAQVGERAGTPPVFSVRLSPGEGKPAITVDLMRDGGHLVSYVNARPAGETNLSLDQAKEVGRSYLAEHGFPDMEPTYGEAVAGFATVQFVHSVDGVLVYPDQIKVRVALDTGEVVGVDAYPYTMAHRERGTLERPAVSQEKAAEALNPALSVQRARLALIPTEAGDGEVLTYEFLTQLGEETYLVYVNAQSGQEERILQMVITPNGTLAL